MTQVYIINSNGKRYVGVTDNLELRMRDHRNQTKSLISRALRKHGGTFEIVFEGTRPECFAEEVRLIAALGTKHPTGYNQTDGGDGYINPDERVRAIFSATMKATMARPEVKAAAIARTKARWASYTPEQRQAQFAKMRAGKEAKQ